MLSADIVISEQQILKKLTTIGFSPGTCTYEKLCLNLSSCSLADLPALSLFTALQRINISSNCITSLRELTQLEQLRCLDASHNNLGAFPDFAEGVDEDQFPRLLTDVNLSFNSIATIHSDIGRLRFIADLNLEGNALKSLQWCRPLVNLQKLNVSENQISVLDGLEDAVLLTDLNISSNSIASLRLVSVLPNLRYLDASKNRIVNVEEISAHIPNLSVLELADNLIASFVGLTDLCRLPLLRDLNLKGNDVACIDQYRNKAVFLLPDLELLDHESLTTLEILQSEISHEKHNEVFPATLAHQCEVVSAEGH